MKTRKGKSKSRQETKCAQTASTQPENSADTTGGPPPGEVVLYRSPDGRIEVDVHLDRETVWLTQRQIAELLDASVPSVNIHLKNIYEEHELEEERTIQEYLIVQTEGSREVRRPVAHYNLDAIIAVGYRVNSRRGTQFRIWATRTLREHLVRGFTLNENRLRERGLGELQQAVSLLARTVTRDHSDRQSRALHEVIERYNLTWRLLGQFDDHNLPARPATPLAPTAQLELEGARALIARLHGMLLTSDLASPLFGREQNSHLHAILGAIEQTFEAKPLYATVQTRAAHLLYFVIKDHPFADGNKRIGTLLFLEYLRRNDLLDLPDGRPRLANNAVVALALLIAESAPRDKELMIRLILNLLDDEDARRTVGSVAEEAERYVVNRAASGGEGANEPIANPGGYAAWSSVGNS